MSLDPQLAALLTDTVSLASVSGRASSGAPTWGSPTSVAARVELYSRRLQQTDGTVLTLSHRIVLDTTRPPLTGDRIWLPGADSSDATQARIVRQVVRAPGLTAGSVSHYEVLV